VNISGQVITQDNTPGRVTYSLPIRDVFVVYPLPVWPCQVNVQTISGQ